MRLFKLKHQARLLVSSQVDNTGKAIPIQNTMKNSIKLKMQSEKSPNTDYICLRLSCR